MPKSQERCQEIREETRNLIIRKSILYFARNGFAGTKISDLSKHIGIAQGTIYIYFKSKEESDKFLGKKVGDKVVFNPYNTCEGNAAELASMLQVDKDKAGEIKGNFEFAIAEIIVVKPADLNQEYFDGLFGKDKVTSEEAYFAEIKKMISSQISGNSDMLFRIQTEKQLVEQYGNVELPETFLKK